MLTRLRQIISDNLPLQFVLGYGSVISAGLIAVTFACSYRAEHLIEQSQQQLGQNSAKQLAQLAVPAVAQGDYIGLQALVSRAVNQPIISAAIYDIENNLLAQAGGKPHSQSEQTVRSFNAPIGLGDNLTGTVNLSLDISASADSAQAMRNWLWAAALIVLAGVAVLSWHFGRALAEQRKAASRALLAMAPDELTEPYCNTFPLREQQLRELLQSVRDYVDSVSSPTPEQIQRAAREIVDCREGRLYLLLACKNLELLKKQVSREPLQILLARAEELIQQFALDNHLTSLPIAGSYLKLALPVVSRDELPQAVACARRQAEALLAQLAAQKSEEFGIRLNWAAALDWHPPAASELARNQQLAQDQQRAEWLCIEADRFELVLSVEAGSWLKGSELELVHSEAGLPFYRRSALIDVSEAGAANAAVAAQTALTPDASEQSETVDNADEAAVQ